MMFVSAIVLNRASTGKYFLIFNYNQRKNYIMIDVFYLNARTVITIENGLFVRFLIVSQSYHHCVQYKPHVGMFWTDFRVRVFCFSL